MIAQAATFVKGFLKLSRSFFEKRRNSRLPFRKKANKFRKISCAGTKTPLRDNRNSMKKGGSLPFAQISRAIPHSALPWPCVVGAGLTGEKRAWAWPGKKGVQAWPGKSGRGLGRGKTGAVKTRISRREKAKIQSSGADYTWLPVHSGRERPP